MSKQMHGLLRMVLALACAGIAVGSVATEAPLKSIPKGPGGRTIERGEYLVMITGCHDCHTPNFLVNGGKSKEADRFHFLLLRFRPAMAPAPRATAPEAIPAGWFSGRRKRV